MCLYPNIVRNTKYQKNKKNGGIIPAVHDPRVLWTPRACGNCMECRQQKAREWTARLTEDIKEHRNGKMITLTFSNESIAKLATIVQENNAKCAGYAMDNAIATIAMRRFNERWRKTHKKALRHWTVTELGHKNTENIHLHGILWTDKDFKEIHKHWQYGHIWPRHDKPDKIKNWVSAQTVNYLVKYVSKIDKDHKNYKQIILTSPGIGANYTHENRPQWKYNKYKPNETDEGYRTETGHKIMMPIYWRNKIYTDEEKEKLWIEKLDKNIRYVNGAKIDVSQGDEKYYKALEHARIINKELGYGDSDKDWNRQEYEHQRRIIIIQSRIQAAEKKRGYQLWTPIDKDWWEH